MGFIHRDCARFGKQHSRYKAILPSIVLSQQCCELVKYTSSLLQQWPWNETQQPNITEITFPNLIGWICPCCSSPRYIPGFCDWVINNKGMIKTVHYKRHTNKLTINGTNSSELPKAFFRCALTRCKVILHQKFQTSPDVFFHSSTSDVMQYIFLWRKEYNLTYSTA